MAVIGQEVTRIVLKQLQAFIESHDGSFSLTDTDTETCIKKITMHVNGKLYQYRRGMVRWKPFPLSAL